MKNFLVLICMALIALVSPVSGARSQTLTTIGFYNVENLYDTVASPFGNDADYAPGGRLRWDAAKYTAKLTNIARVLDELSADIVGIAEIESELAVRDLVMTLGTDYNYIHRTSGDRRGMDIAVLYKGDKFIPEHIRMVRSGSPREILYVRGELLGERIDFLVCHLPSQMNSSSYRDKVLRSVHAFADSLHGADPGARIVFAGDFNADPADRVMRRHFGTGKEDVDMSRPMFVPFSQLARCGIGSYVYDNRWSLYDNIFLDTRFLSGKGLSYRDCGVLVRQWMLTPGPGRRQGYPLRTFASGVYTGGYSDHLPVYVALERN